MHTIGVIGRVRERHRPRRLGRACKRATPLITNCGPFHSCRTHFNTINPRLPPPYCTVQKQYKSCRTLHSIQEPSVTPIPMFSSCIVSGFFNLTSGNRVLIRNHYNVVPNQTPTLNGTHYAFYDSLITCGDDSFASAVIRVPCQPTDTFQCRTHFLAQATIPYLLLCALLTSLTFYLLGPAVP
jgi:hypothetical protein